MSADAPKGSAVRPATGANGTFPRSARLLKHSDFERVYKQGRRHFSPLLTVFYLPRGNSLTPLDSELGSRVGFTVGRVLGGAVQRNRIKRRLREAVRQRRAALNGAPSVDVVINPKKSVLTAEFAAVVNEVGRALELIAKKIART